MKKILLLLAVILVCFGLLTLFNLYQSRQTPGPAEEEPENLLLQGRLDSWQDGMLRLTDGDGTGWEMAAAEELWQSNWELEPGFELLVEADGSSVPVRALKVTVLAPPADLAQARTIMLSLSREEKAGQMFLARCPAEGAAQAVSDYHLAGYILFDRDFAHSTPEQVRTDIASYQQAASLPLLIGVDEEGGTVTRVSCYPAFRSSRFAAPQKLYNEGGLDLICRDAEEKCLLLSGLGINLNFAPVADVSVSPSDFIYDRSLGQDGAATADYVAAVVRVMQEQGVGPVLKHFPGYGSNGDTHTGVITDLRPAEEFYRSDFLPFSAGIQAGAAMVLVSHNIVTAFDPDYPASLSPALHRLLRVELGFDGIIITDDLVMGGISQLYDPGEAAVLAVLAGNDLLLSSDHASQIAAVLDAVEQGRIQEELLDAAVVRVLRYKIRVGLI